VNHYQLFPNGLYANGLTPYLSLEGSQLQSNLFVGSGVPIVNYTGVTCPVASPAVFTLSLNTSATIANGRAVKLGGNIPTGFTKNKVYYVVATSTDTFELALAPGGSAINATANASTASAPTTVYDVTGMTLGNAEVSGEQGSVDFSPGIPFLEGYSSILAVSASFLASNFTTVYVEGASDVAGTIPAGSATGDIPGAWTALATLNQAGVGAIPTQFLPVALPQYIRLRVNVLTDFSGGGSGAGTGIVTQSSAALLGN